MMRRHVILLLISAVLVALLLFYPWYSGGVPGPAAVVDYSPIPIKTRDLMDTAQQTQVEIIKPAKKNSIPITTPKRLVALPPESAVEPPTDPIGPNSGPSRIKNAQAAFARAAKPIREDVVLVQQPQQQLHQPLDPQQQPAPEWGQSKAYRAFYNHLCYHNITECCRIDPNIVDTLNTLIAPAVAFPPPKNVKLVTEPTTPYASGLDCTQQRFSHIFTGQVRSKPVKIIDTVLFSHELDILLVRLLEYQGAVDHVALAIFPYTFRGTHLPDFSCMSPERLNPFESMLIRLPMEKCPDLLETTMKRRKNFEVGKEGDGGNILFFQNSILSPPRPESISKWILG